MPKSRLPTRRVPLPDRDGFLLQTVVTLGLIATVTLTLAVRSFRKNVR
jgi:hypothetical protein